MHSPSNSSALPPAQAAAAIWNPAAAACWSIVFTPAFGAYILMRNWEALGQPRQAALARKWFCFSLGLLAVQVLSTAFNARLNSQSDLVQWCGLGNLAAWCVGAVLPQARLVRARFGAGYPRKAWDHALLAAVVAGTAYFAVKGFFTFLFVALT
jgi:hypothetical protein